MALTPAQQGTEMHKAAAVHLDQRRAEADAARNAGYAHAHQINQDYDGKSSLWAVLELAFERDNPYKMVAYADEGHERPAWHEGFNRALLDLASLKHVGRDDIGEDYVGALNGQMPTTAHCSRRLENYEEAEAAAKLLTSVFGVPFWGEDRGEWVAPRYAVVPGYRVGEPVSYGFNGDSYIAGLVTNISGGPDGRRIITVTSTKSGVVSKFWRRGLAGSWRKDGTWSLMHGWHRDTNWSF